MTTEEYLAMNDRRFVSQSTGIICARCGETFKVSNRHILPFTFERINDSIGKIMMPCAKCGVIYDLGICRYE